MPVYRVIGVGQDDRAFERRVEAAEAQEAASSFRQQGCTVSSVEMVSGPDLERECHQCQETNPIETIRCRNCRATLRGHSINSTRQIELPSGYDVHPQGDGALRVTRIGVFWWRRYLASTLVMSVVLIGGGLVLFMVAGASDRALIFLAAVMGTVILSCFAWALFGSCGWIVMPGAFHTWARILGRTITRKYSDAGVWIDRRVTQGMEAGSIRQSWWCVGLETLERDVAICTESSPERAEAIAAFIAQKTGWPLDNRLERTGSSM